MVLNASTKRETGRVAQLNNIQAAKVLIIAHRFSTMTLDLGGGRYHPNHARPAIHAEDVAGPHGRHRDDK